MYLDFAGSPHGGVLKLLPEADRQARIKPVGLVHHTIVGSAAGAYYFFRDATGTESTFILPKTGVIWELMALDRVSDAQVVGNYWEAAGGKAYGFLSVETEDNGDPEHDPWTRAQLDSLRWLNDKLARVFGWARKQTVAPSGPDAAGTGYHSMWGINTATAHLNPWTIANGKTCPATPRIGQYKATLLPAYVHPTPTPTPTPTPEDDMTPEEHALLEGTNANVNAIRAQFNPANSAGILDKLNRTGTRLAEVQDAVKAQGAQLDDLVAAVKALTPTPPPAG